jgi:Dolichyl-phosphate-mannose-protein mannosyltransferase
LTLMPAAAYNQAMHVKHKRNWLTAALGIGGGWLLTLLVGWPSLAYPLGRDNGIFAYTGWAMLRGQVPYINFWEHKTPLIFFIYAAIMKLFGATEAGVRIGDLVYTLLVIPFLYLLVDNLFGRRAATFAALTWAVFHTAVNTLYFWSGAESETFMVLPIILATYCYRRAEQQDAHRALGANRSSPLQGSQGGRGELRFAATPQPYHTRWGWMVATGFFAGVAVMIKVTAVVGLSGLALYALLDGQRGSAWWAWAGATLRRLGLTLLGFALALVPFVLYFVANRALAEAIDVSIIANFFYGGAGNSLTVAGGDLLGRIGADLIGLRFYYVLPAIALIYIVVRERSRAALLVALWLAATFGMTWIQGRLWPYHYIGTLVPLSILCGFIIDRALCEIATHPQSLPAGEEINPSPIGGGGERVRSTANTRPQPLPTGGEINPSPIGGGGERGSSATDTHPQPLPTGGEINPSPIGEGGDRARAAPLTGYVATAVLLLALALWSLAPGNGTETFYSWDRYLQYQSGKITQRQYYADFHRGTYDYLPNRDAGEYIGAHTTPGQTALVWAVDPLVNLIAGRLAPGRFIYNYPIVAEEVPVAARDRYKQIFMQELDRNRPQIIAVAEGDTSPITPRDSLSLLADFPAFGAVLTNEYHLVKEIPPGPNKGETFLIYERNVKP